MTQEEKIGNLERRLAIMDADSSALCVDLAHWKKVAAGLKGRNKQLSERVEHYKQLDLEGDELNERRLAEIEEMNKVIEGLQAQVNGLATKNKELEFEVKEKQDLIDEHKLTIHELKTPWWKKIF